MSCTLDALFFLCRTVKYVILISHAIFISTFLVSLAVVLFIFATTSIFRFHKSTAFKRRMAVCQRQTNLYYAFKWSKIYDTCLRSSLLYWLHHLNCAERVNRMLIKRHIHHFIKNINVLLFVFDFFVRLK